MPAFKKKRVLVYYAVFKKHIGFYPTNTPIDHFSERLKEFKTSKGAIQFPINDPLPIDVIMDIVRFRDTEDAQL